MKRLAAPALAALALALASCGGTTKTVTVYTPPAAAAPAPHACDPAPGKGVMGVCEAPSPRLPFSALSLRASNLIPDVSEYQACALHSPAIFRIYEAGTDREDVAAACHARELRRLHVWAGAYFFARNKSCGYQAARAGAIARRYPVIRVLVVDAEVPMATGLVSCLVRHLQAQHFTVVTYTGTGTWPGGVIITAWWAASYGARPGCLPNTCRFVAWQFSERFACRGVFGDCSIDFGITSLGAVPVSPLRKSSTAGLIHHRASLRVFLATHGCRRLEHQHRRRGPRCRSAETAGRNINHELHRRGVQ